MSTGGLSKQTKRALAKKFKLSGLVVSGKALKGVHRQLVREEDQEGSLQIIIHGVKAYMKQNHVQSAVVTEDIIMQVVADLSKNDDDRQMESLQLIDAFHTTNLSFNREKKEFFVVPSANACLNADASRKMEMYCTRLSLIHQRLLRNPSFRAPVNIGGKKEEENYLKLCAIESLIGTTGQQCVLGLLFRSHEKLFLEDFNSSIELRMHEGTTVHDGIFTESCAVVVQGEYVDGIFEVDAIGTAPSEPRSVSIPALGDISLMGLALNSEAYDSMLRVEKESSALPIAVLSEVHLDQAEVLEKLRYVFDELEDLKPSLVILMGNFSSKPFGHSYSDRSQYQKGFDNLADIMTGYQELCQSTRFIFVPGPSDPGSANVLPRMPIPAIFARKLRARVPSAHFTTNPTRIRFYTQEFVFFRENLITKMRRHRILEPTVDGEGISVTKQLVKSILDSAHLCPLPLKARPVYWAFEHALRLYPQPNCIFLADQHDSYSRSYKGTKVNNPGSFASDFSMLKFWPSDGRLETQVFDI